MRKCSSFILFPITVLFTHLVPTHWWVEEVLGLVLAHWQMKLAAGMWLKGPEVPEQVLDFWWMGLVPDTAGHRVQGVLKLRPACWWTGLDLGRLRGPRCLRVGIDLLVGGPGPAMAGWGAVVVLGMVETHMVSLRSAPLSFKAKYSGGLFSQGWVPGLGSSTWGSDRSPPGRGSAVVTIVLSMGHQPGRVDLGYTATSFPLPLSLWFLFYIPSCRSSFLVASSLFHWELLCK